MKKTYLIAAAALLAIPAVALAHEHGEHRGKERHGDWIERLDSIARELEAEPARIQDSYIVKATRIEPVGVVYLWPVSS